jgi:hypothetical protein
MQCRTGANDEEYEKEAPLITTEEGGLAAMVNGARCHHADPRVKAAVLLALKKLIRGAGNCVMHNGQTVYSNIGEDRSTDDLNVKLNMSKKPRCVLSHSRTSVR